MYAVRVLSSGDLMTARSYLERVADPGPAGPNERALFYRDLAEVRLALGDRAGAAAAVNSAAEAQSQQPLNARFTPGERRLAQRTLEALRAAADADVAGLAAACSTDERPPAVDACYLLGWTYEGRGEVASARAAYQTYVDRAPTWSFLRRAPLMRQHAEAFLAQASR
jgi:hypothetical protein